MSDEERLIPEPNSFPEANNLGIVPLEQLENDFHEEVSSRVSTEYARVPGTIDFRHESLCSTTGPFGVAVQR